MKATCSLINMSKFYAMNVILDYILQLFQLKKEHRTFTWDHRSPWKETIFTRYHPVLFEDTRSALWGLLRMNSIIPVMIPRGAGSIPRDDRTQSGSHTSLWCGRRERNASRLRRQELRWREGTSSKAQPAAEYQLLGFGKLLSISLRQAIVEAVEVVVVEVCSLLFSVYPQQGSNIVYLCTRILLLKLK